MWYMIIWLLYRNRSPYLAGETWQQFHIKIIIPYNIEDSDQVKKERRNKKVESVDLIFVFIFYFSREIPFVNVSL